MLFLMPNQQCQSTEGMNTKPQMKHKNLKPGSTISGLEMEQTYSHNTGVHTLGETPRPFYGPFSGTTQVSQCQKRTSGLYGARED